ncbi:hypothetical protein Ga0080559_TMP3332 [Salipiger profundus]|uniref:Uncharacterized protein n=1 Tax=Salipiger profundus TaxID=1229727 RepID=A0A1U7D7P2_9RHOB|nr:hypothetical protein Ga0080559_TMP3332 [Salipiger profundus]
MAPARDSGAEHATRGALAGRKTLGCGFGQSRGANFKGHAKSASK